MKKIFLLMLVLTGFCSNASAQFFVTGTAGLGYRNESFSMTLLPGCGYEFNDRWAVGTGLGLFLADEEARGVVNPYVRFNCWNNSRLFFDLKATSEIVFGDGTNTFVGLRPSMRYAFSDHLQLSADVGLLGLDIDNGATSAAVGFATSGIDVSVIYKF